MKPSRSVVAKICVTAAFVVFAALLASTFPSTHEYRRTAEYRTETATLRIAMLAISMAEEDFYAKTGRYASLLRNPNTEATKILGLELDLSGHGYTLSMASRAHPRITCRMHYDSRDLDPGPEQCLEGGRKFEE